MSTLSSLIKIAQWLRLIASLLGRMWQSSPRPIRNRETGIGISLPALFPTRTLSLTRMMAFPRTERNSPDEPY